MNESPVVPLEVAAEHYRDGMIRGENAGTYKEYLRILTVLKNHGHYDAVLTLKKHAKKDAQWSYQPVI